MIHARCLTSFNRFQLPSSEATPWPLQTHKGNMPRSWLRDTDIQNGDALLCFIIMITVKIAYIKKYITLFYYCYYNYYFDLFNYNYFVASEKLFVL